MNETETVQIKKEKTDDTDPDDVVPPPIKKTPAAQLMPPVEKSPYAEITVTGKEIDTLKKQANADAPEGDKISYHNSRVAQIQGAIRKAAKNKEKCAFIGSSHLDNKNNELWKRIILEQIASKLRKNNVRAQFSDENGWFNVDL